MIYVTRSSCKPIGLPKQKSGQGEEMSTKVRATIEDLYSVPEHGKAEIIDGELIRFIPTGGIPSRASFNIAFSLRMHEQSQGDGYAISDNAGFLVDLPNRESFSPDAAWWVGDQLSMKFFEGAPAFAAEVRSENDYGAKAEKDLEQKRKDYFAAGTLVVWDVDLLSDEVVKVYRKDNPDHPTIYRKNEYAEAEPAVRDWKMAVDDLFR
jgi:Uma2 family endonuclease